MVVEDVPRQWVPLARAIEIEGVGKSQMYRRRRRGHYPVEERGGKILWGVPLPEDDAAPVEAQGTVPGTAQGTLESHPVGTRLPALPLHDYVLRDNRALRGERDRLLDTLDAHASTIQALADTVRVQEDRILALTSPDAARPSSRRWWHIWRPHPRIRVAY
jgi:hypothetical protein